MVRLKSKFTLTRRILSGYRTILLVLLSALIGLSGCSVPTVTMVSTQVVPTTEIPPAELTEAVITVTPLPQRPNYNPGELVDYTAQAGDTLPALAAHFNTTVEEIQAANTFIPKDATTMPPGMPMKIPIYYAPFWGSAYQIIPDSLFINGPAQVGFNSSEFVANHSGWLNGYREYAFNGNRSAAQIVDYVSQQFSVSPRLLLALLEYQAGGLSQLARPADGTSYVLGKTDVRRQGLYLQLVWAANTLNNGYYEWRVGNLRTMDMLDGRELRPDPWQNAASVALQYYFSRLYDGELFDRAVAHDGIAQVYKDLFGDPWGAEPHIPGSLTQPEFRLPFRPGIEWAYTGGPHTGYGTGAPYAALDFAPGAVKGGCTPTPELALAVADGVVARSELGTVVLDLDGDGDERTGWVLFYFHIGTEGRAVKGAGLKSGDPLGYPSCEGGATTGTHIHIARKYNGEWVLADGILAFNLDGWVAHNGAVAYQGTLTRDTKMIRACECSDAASQILAEER